MITIGLRNELKAHMDVRVAYDGLENVEAPDLQEDILVDAASINHTELYEFLQEHRGRKIIYLVDTKTPSMLAFAAAHHIDVMEPEEWLASQQTDQGTPSTPILAFWGVYPRLGTTTIALAVGHILATKYGKNVGILGMNAYNSGRSMIPKTDRSLDDILPFLKLQRLERDALVASMESFERIKYLPGLRNQTQAGVLYPEHVRHLLSVASSAFDTLIVDVGSVLNTALALEGLHLATHRYVVSDDLLATQHQFFDHQNYVLKPLGISSDQLMLVGSRLHSKGVAFAKSIDVLPVASIPDFPSIDLVAEQQSNPLKLFLDEKAFRRAIDAIADAASAQTQKEGSSHDRRVARRAAVPAQ